MSSGAVGIIVFLLLISAGQIYLAVQIDELLSNIRDWRTEVNDAINT